MCGYVDAGGGGGPFLKRVHAKPPSYEPINDFTILLVVCCSFVWFGGWSPGERALKCSFLLIASMRCRMVVFT